MPAQNSSRRIAPDEEFQMKNSLSATLAAITLPDADERPVQLGTLWSDSPAVVVFLRHYG